MERPKDEKSQEESECHHDNSNGVNNSRRKTVCPAAGEHPLQYNYTFWYSRRTPSRPASSQSYEQNIRQIGTVASVEQFWRFYSHLIRPGDLSGHSDFHLFKEGIKPMWEDESNRSGGKWIIRCGKAWPVASGRTSSWPCWGSSSWWGRRSAAPWSPYASRRTSCPSGTEPPTTK
uniref:Eukaryotic translation initiation factor 4E family member 2 related sequence 1 n=1 Tax=Tetraodon nigroviridis TaxID=99883 RepID=H3CDU7_TETNG